MIVDAIIVTQGGKIFKRIHRKKPYYACGYIGNQIIEMTTYNENEEFKGAIQGGLYTDGNIEMSGFSAISWNEFVKEIEKRGLKYP